MGYVKSIKSENIYGNTFGNTTRDVDAEAYPKGQDLRSRDKYVSTTTTSMVPPSERLQRTAADIVGVPNTKINVSEV